MFVDLIQKFRTYLVSITLETPHKINNFAHNTFTPSMIHPLSAVVSNKLKFCRFV
jgi:hypothetical protein